MALQTQDLDVRQEVSLLETGKAANGFDMIGLGIAVGHSGAALSATMTVAEEGQSLGVHAAGTSTFQELKVDFPIEVFKIATSAWPIRNWSAKIIDHLHLLGSHQRTTFVDADSRANSVSSQAFRRREVELAT